MKKQAAVYEVPVLISSTKDDKFEVVHVKLLKLSEFKTQAEAQQAYRMVCIDNNWYARKFFSGPDVELVDLEIYTNHLGLSMNHRELGPNFECPPEVSGRFKIGTYTTARVLKACYLFGYLTRTQYRAADRERITLALEESQAASAAEAEADLDHLLMHGLSPTRAKKIIDALVKQEKQAKKDAALRLFNDSRSGGLPQVL